MDFCALQDRIDIHVDIFTWEERSITFKKISGYKGFSFTGHQCGDLCKMYRIG